MLKKAAILYGVAWVAAYAVSELVYQSNPDLGWHLWENAKTVLIWPWIFLGKAIAAFFAMFSGTPGMIDDQAINTVAVFALVIAFFVWGVPWMWKKMWSGGGAKAHH